MSVTTVAAPMQPDRVRVALPDTRPERFTRSDFIAAAIVFGVTLLVYVLTLAADGHAGGFRRAHHRRGRLRRAASARLSALDDVGLSLFAPHPVRQRGVADQPRSRPVFGAAANAVLTLLGLPFGPLARAALGGGGAAAARAPLDVLHRHVRGNGHRLQRRDVEPGRDRRGLHTQRPLRESRAPALVFLDARAAQDPSAHHRGLRLRARADESPHAHPDDSPPCCWRRH